MGCWKREPDPPIRKDQTRHLFLWSVICGLFLGKTDAHECYGGICFQAWLSTRPRQWIGLCYKTVQRRKNLPLRPLWGTNPISSKIITPGWVSCGVDLSIPVAGSCFGSVTALRPASRKGLKNPLSGFLYRYRSSGLWGAWPNLGPYWLSRRSAVNTARLDWAGALTQEPGELGWVELRRPGSTSVSESRYELAILRWLLQVNQQIILIDLTSESDQTDVKNIGCSGWLICLCSDAYNSPVILMARCNHPPFKSLSEFRVFPSKHRIGSCRRIHHYRAQKFPNKTISSGAEKFSAFLKIHLIMFSVQLLKIAHFPLSVIGGKTATMSGINEVNQVALDQKISSSSKVFLR